MGLYDDIANIELIKDKMEVDKIFYIGFSQGTTQMFYSMANDDESFYQDNLYKAVMLAPCMIQNNTDMKAKKALADVSMALPSKANAYSSGGPNWPEEIKRICKEFDKATCDAYTVNAQYTQPEAIKSQQHFYQNQVADRFQDFVPIDKWVKGETEGKLVPLEDIKNVPITAFAGAAD